MQKRPQLSDSKPTHGPDPVAVAELIATLEPGYFRHKEVTGYDTQVQLDAVFFDAACLDDYARVGKALELGANVNVVHPGLGATAMHIAVGRENRELIEFLLRYGASMDVEDKNRVTPLDDAWRRARLEIDTPFAEWAERAWREKSPQARASSH